MLPIVPFLLVAITWLPTAVLTNILFARKRGWISTGILAAVGINMLLMSPSALEDSAFCQIEAWIWLLAVITAHLLFGKARTRFGRLVVSAFIVITLALPVVMRVETNPSWLWLFPYPGTFYPGCC